MTDSAKSFKTHQVQTQFGYLEILQFGNHKRKKSIIFLPGLSCPWNHYHHQIEHLKANYNIYFVIYPGHESLPQEPRSFDYIVNEVLEVLDFFKIKKSFIIGHSLGSPLALMCALKKPRQFEALVHINGFAKNPLTLFKSQFLENRLTQIKNFAEEFPNIANRIWNIGMDHSLGFKVAGWIGGFNLELTEHKDIEIYASFLKHQKATDVLFYLKEILKLNLVEQLTTLKQPQLILAGSKDKITPLKYQYELHDLLLNSKLEIFPTGSHCTQLDHPQNVTMLVEGFLG